MKRVRVLAAALALCTAASAAASPEDVTVRYTMHLSGIYIADVEDRLEFGSDGTYRFSSDAVAIGLAAMLGAGDVARTSHGRRDDGASMLLVEEFLHDHQGKLRRSQVQRSEGAIAIDYEGALSTVSIEPGSEVADNLTLSYLFYAYAERANGSLEVLFTDGKRAKPYRFERAESAETITVPAGTFEAVRFDRAEEGKKGTFWFVPELGLLPGRVLIGSASTPVEFLLVSAEASDGSILAGQPPADAKQ